jgi:hypothetical protein
LEANALLTIVWKELKVMPVASELLAASVITSEFGFGAYEPTVKMA